MELKEKIEEARNELHNILVDDLSEATEILKQSQELDSLILEFQKYVK
jgi:hypothetical protein